MSPTIRRARPDDAPVVARFNMLLAEESEGKSLDPATVNAGVRAILSDPSKGLYFLAERGGEVVGQLMVTFEWSDWRNGWIWWLQSVYVRDDARRQGIFRALFDNLMKEARNDPTVIGLRLYVENDNHSAHQTYLSLGLQRTSYHVLERCPL